MLSVYAFFYISFLRSRILDCKKNLSLSGDVLHFSLQKVSTEDFIPSHPISAPGGQNMLKLCEKLLYQILIKKRYVATHGVDNSSLHLLLKKLQQV